MLSVKIVIIGGVAAGASAAAKARRINEEAEIVVFEKGPYVSFANCGLPYYVSEEIKERDELLLQTPESFWNRFRVQVKAEHEVTQICKEQKTVRVKDLKNNTEFEESYDKLIIATGAEAIIPPLKGMQARNIFTVKTIPDTDQIKTFIQDYHPEKALVIGGGFIGLETAEALKTIGLDVTVVELQNQLLPPLDQDLTCFVEDHIQIKGLGVVLGDGIKGFEVKEQQGIQMAWQAELNSGSKLPMDLAILSIGVRPEIRLAQEIGLQIGKAGGIVVNEYQETSEPDIYAAGDIVEMKHLVTGQPVRIPLAGPANKQGRVAGANAAGSKLRFPGAIGTAIVKTMGITAAKTGLSEKETRQAGYDYQISVTHSYDHANYYPGAVMMHIKLLSDKKDRRLLGAQIVGETGVDKRIDVLATAISAKMTVDDLENLDLAYAPQFSSAKDPVVVAGFVSSNIFKGEVQIITSEDLQQCRLKGETIQLIDVRNKDEFNAGHIEGALHIPVDEIRERLSELNPEKLTVTYCQIGLRGYLAARILMQRGFKSVFNLTGGMLSYFD